MQISVMSSGGLSRQRVSLNRHVTGAILWGMNKAGSLLFPNLRGCISPYDECGWQRSLRVSLWERDVRRTGLGNED